MVVQTRTQTRQGGDPAPPTIQPFSGAIEKNNLINHPALRSRPIIRPDATTTRLKAHVVVEEPQPPTENKPLLLLLLQQSEELLPHKKRQAVETNSSTRRSQGIERRRHQRPSNASDLDRAASGGYSVPPFLPNIIGVSWALQHVLRGIVFHLRGPDELHNLLIAIPALRPLFETPDPPRPLGLAWRD